MQSTFTDSALEDFLPNQWINWCRLCAKDDKQHNINFLYQNENHLKNENKNLNIQEALAKYFYVQTSLEDPLPKMICTNCLSLVSSMINFNERVERVQLMFSHLVENRNSTSCQDLNSVRLKFDVTESERDYWFNKYPACGLEKECNELTLGESKKHTGIEGKVHIKLENVENHTNMSNDVYIEEDPELEKEEMVYPENINDSFAEEEEDPFLHNEKRMKSFSEEEEREKPIQISSHKIEHNNGKSKLDRSKQKKRKRKKLKQFSSLDCKKKKITIKDFKMEGTCKECGENFLRYIPFREHMQQHDHMRDEKHWPCPVCDKVLLSLYNLERHVRIHVPLDARQTIKCSECDNRYTSNAQLETHIRYKHKNEKPFICEECGLCLRTNSNLRQHMLIHTDIAPFECEVCKKKFKNKTRLKTHMDIHSPNKHMCNICGLQLNSRATLNRHFLVHSDEMQHKCDYCGKAFKRAKALKNHLLLHTGLKPYSCDFCERTFANGSNCRSHMKKMHPDELAVLEASGNKTHTKNIPKLETLKAVTKAADNLTPVVTKFSGCFAFGKKPKLLANSKEEALKSQQAVTNSAASQNDNEKLSVGSPSSTPLDLQYIPLDGNSTNSSGLPEEKNVDNDLLTSAETTTAPIPNFDNIYQHLIKQNQSEIEVKRSISQLSPQADVSNVNIPHHNTFYPDIMATHSIKSSAHASNDLLRSPESQHSTMAPLTQNEHKMFQQGTFYGSVRTTLPPDDFI